MQQSPKSENNQNHPHQATRYNVALKESSKFLRDSNERLYQMKQIKDNIEINNENLRNGYYLKKKQPLSPQHPLNSLEQTFKQHICSFRSFFTYANHHNNSPNSKQEIFSRTRTETSLHNKQQQLGTLILEAKEVCEDIIPQINSIKREEKRSRMKWKGMQKVFLRDTSVESWQNDQKYRQVKENLRKMQEDDLPGYFKFCLINSKENLRNMRRANQEIKETRFLWYQLQKQKKEGQPDEKYSEERIQQFLQDILKRFQRIKTNQFIEKSKDHSWKLKSEKSELRNRDKEDYKMIVENLDIRKSISNEQDLKTKFEKFEKQLKEDSQRKKNILDKQKNQQIDHIIQRSYDRIFNLKSNQKSIKTEESEYKKNIYLTRDLSEKNLQNIDQIKNQLKNAKIQIKRKHVDNYSSNQLPQFLKKVFSTEKR